jgi:hypothetical protein
VAERDWVDWHDAYDRPGSSLVERLAVVQRLIAATLDRAPGGPIKAISVCAGQGRDLLGVLEEHPRAGDVVSRFVEIDPRNADVARTRATAAGLAGVDVVTGDAASTRNYVGYAPADLVLVCGVYGNISDEDIERTVGFCTQLCATEGTVIWTRARGERGMFPRICEWYESRGFERVWVTDPDRPYGVGAHRFTGTPAPLEPDATMFTFLPRF